MNQHSDVKRASATPAPPAHRCPTCGKPKVESKPPVIRTTYQGGKAIQKVGPITI